MINCVDTIVGVDCGKDSVDLKNRDVHELYFHVNVDVLQVGSNGMQKACIYYFCSIINLAKSET